MRLHRFFPRLMVDCVCVHSFEEHIVRLFVMSNVVAVFRSVLTLQLVVYITDISLTATGSFRMELVLRLAFVMHQERVTKRARALLHNRKAIVSHLDSWFSTVSHLESCY